MPLSFDHSLTRQHDAAPAAPGHLSQAAALVEIVRASAGLMEALRAARALDLSSWCIGAGAVRGCIWDHLHGYPVGASLDEADLVYFDDRSSLSRDAELQAVLTAQCPRVRWDVANQAHVHVWYQQYFGLPVEALGSLEAGIATWPEFATCVGIRLERDDTLTVIAPHGLDDLFSLVVRRNPARANAQMFNARHAGKRWTQRWPRLQVLTAIPA